MGSDVRYHKQARVLPRKVWFTGSTALSEGQGLCFDYDYGTATDADGRRDNYVELPSTTNNRHFAGVCAQDYAAQAGGQFIEIHEPGSTCQVAIAADVTLGDLLCCTVGGVAGRFIKPGLMGRGAVRILQTNASGSLEEDLTGATALSSTGKVMTDSAATFETAGLVAGDKVAILGGEDDDTNATTAGVYMIASVDSETQLTLTEAASDGGTMQCSYVAYSGNPMALAHLYDGEESGLVEFVPADSPGHATADTFAIMQSGWSYILGGVTIATANCRAPLDDPTDAYGLKKGLYCLGALTTSDAEIETTTDGLQADGATAMHAITFDAADEMIVIEWQGLWVELLHSGCAIAAT